MDGPRYIFNITLNTECGHEWLSIELDVIVDSGSKRRWFSTKNLYNIGSEQRSWRRTKQTQLATLEKPTENRRTKYSSQMHEKPFTVEAKCCI